MSDKNAAARLEAMRERMSKHKSNAGGADYWKPEEGDSTFRILPPTGKMVFWWQEVGKHVMGSEKDAKTLLCPNFTTDGELPCPFCELSQQAYDEGDKELASKLKPRRYYHMNVLVEGAKGAMEGPFVYTPGIQVFETLTALVQNPDYGDISDTENGFDLRITREGKKLDTKYTILPRRNPSPFAKTQEEADEIFSKMKDLSVIKNHLPSYEELQNELNSGSEYESTEDPENFN